MSYCPAYRRLTICCHILAAALLVALAGCDSTIDRYPANDVYALTLTRSRDVPSEAANRDTQDVVTELFGTPDQPAWPAGWLDSSAAQSLVQKDRLERAAGAVSSQKDGTHRGLFREHCVTCHGVSGDGAGPASATQNPYPRDFRHGVFKWKSTERADKPTREDLRSVLERGIAGTGMPSFSLLAPDDIDALVDYTIYLSVRGEVERRLMAASIDVLGYEETPPDKDAELSVEQGSDGAEVVRQVVNRVVDGWVDAMPTPVAAGWKDLDGEALSASIERGRELFHGRVANCVGCHGTEGNGQSVTLDYDDWTKEYSTRLGLTPDDREAMRPFRDAGALRPRPIQPRNLQQAVLRGGNDPDQLYRRITQGIAGTPMPAVTVVEEPNGLGLTNDQVWDLVRYIRALGENSP